MPSFCCEMVRTRFYYPDRDIAESLAVSLSSSHVFDYIELTDEYSISADLHGGDLGGQDH